MNIQAKNTILITCSRGLSTCLQEETQRLGYPLESSHETGVEINASFSDAMKLNLQLSTAFNVLYLPKRFSAQTIDELYKNVLSYPWEELIDVTEYVCVVSQTHTPAITNSMFANQKVKDALVDRLVQKTGKRPDAGPERDNIVINLYWHGSDCWLYLNTSGRKLADRGYRQIPHTAPLQESLAAGILLSTGYNGTQPLVIPMCGSGTLAIEAAFIALNRAPGLLRTNFGFMHIKDFDKTLWQDIRIEVLNQSKKSMSAPIIATDIDKKAIQAAKKNALIAGVAHLIDFRICDFADTPIPQEKGIIIINPPYGERMGDIPELEITYKRLGDFFKQNCGGHTGYIFTGNPDLAKKIGLRTSQRLQFFNGDIECRLLRYELYAGSKKKEPSD